MRAAIRWSTEHFDALHKRLTGIPIAHSDVSSPSDCTNGDESIPSPEGDA